MLSVYWKCATVVKSVWCCVFFFPAYWGASTGTNDKLDLEIRNINCLHLKIDNELDENIYSHGNILYNSKSNHNLSI